MAVDPAASAYGHCLAVLEDDELAATAAAAALRRGGRSRSAVLGHARHLALSAAAEHPTEAAPTALGDDAAPVDVAQALAATRPALERALIDLESRHDLSRAGRARAIGLSAPVAATRSAAIGASWDRELDPALMAWLGPGDCQALAELLAGGVEGEATTAEGLLQAGQSVAHHTDDCDACADRRRALVSVRTLFGQAPLPTDVPNVVRDAARAGRRRPPVPPPPLEPVGRGHRLARAGLLLVAIAILIVAGVAALTTLDDDGDDENVALLTEIDVDRSTLQLVPSELDLTTRGALLRNEGSRAVEWRASTTASWVAVRPSRGVLGAGEEQELQVQVTDQAPEGRLLAAVTVTGDDGSTAATTVTGILERPPDVAANVDGCLVTATAEDEGEVASVVLSWRSAGGEQAAEMNDAEQGSVAALPAEPTPLTWWVTAVDARGNRARTSDAVLPPGHCQT